MPRPRLLTGKPLLLLAALVVFTWLVPAYLKTLVREAFSYLQAPWVAATGELGTLHDYSSDYLRGRDALMERGQDLARLNAAYELRIQESRALEAEVARLEQLLALPPLSEFRYEIARVTQRDFSLWWHEFTINKGEQHGLVPGAAVVFAEGVVGRVRSVGPVSSQIELVTSPTFRMAAHFEDDLRPVTYRGGRNQPFEPPTGMVQHVPPDIQTALDEPVRLVSSRLGGVFPDGLAIGSVFRLRAGSDGLFQSGTVRLHPGLLTLREVSVLIPIETSAPNP